MSTLAGGAEAQFGDPNPLIYSSGSDRVCDPKLDGGGAHAAFYFVGQTGSSVSVRVDIESSRVFVTRVWRGARQGGAPPTTVVWDGRDASGDYVDTGDYKFVVRNPSGTQEWLARRVSVVRLGIVEVEFEDTPSATDEWQMVYFKRDGISPLYTATPAIGEYDNRSAASVSDLDQDNGDPRPAVALHTATDEPVMDGPLPATQGYNYPLAYRAGAEPQMKVTLGDGGTTVGGAAMGSHYPLIGIDIRMVGTLPSGKLLRTAPISPGSTVTLPTEALTPEVRRTDWDVEWRFEYSTGSGGSWYPIRGSHTIEHRFYTIWSDPIFPAGVGGTNYAGPWVEVADYVAEWCETLGVSTNGSDLGLIENVVRGFFGGSAPFGAPVEGVIYDSPAYCNDDDCSEATLGSPAYWLTVTDCLDLSSFLDDALSGVYINCDDASMLTATMLAMMGVSNLETIEVLDLSLNAIWPIGAPGYTTAVGGPGLPHALDYHRFVSRDGGAHVIDTCFQVDEDGMPATTPGFPGWNVERDWAGPNGYDQLLSTNALLIEAERIDPLFPIL